MVLCSQKCWNAHQDLHTNQQKQQLNVAKYSNIWKKVAWTARETAHTQKGGHAWDESTVSGIMRLCIHRDKYGVGLGEPHTVLADLGCGLGQVVFFAGANYRVKPVCIGVEEDPHLFLQSLELQRKLTWERPAESQRVLLEAPVALLKAKAQDVGSLEGITNVQLYDGHRMPKSYGKNDRGHVSLIGKIMSTISIDEFSSTKFRPEALSSYKDDNPMIRKFADQFECTLIKDWSFKTNKMTVAMWVRKLEFRAHRTPPTTDTTIGALIKQAKETPTRVQKHYRDVGLVKVSDVWKANQHITENSDVVFLGAKLRDGLTGCEVSTGSVVSKLIDQREGSSLVQLCQRQVEAGRSFGSMTFKLSRYFQLRRWWSISKNSYTSRELQLGIT